MKDIFGKLIPIIVISVCAVLIVTLTDIKTLPESETAASETVAVNIMGQEQAFRTTDQGQEPAETYCLTTEFPVPVSVSEFSGITVEINGIPFQSGESGTVQLERLCTDEYITISFFGLDGTSIGESRIRTLPLDAAQWRADSRQDGASGIYYFDCAQYLYKVNADGKLLYYRNCLANVSDFMPHDVDGERYYSYLTEVGEPSMEQKARGETHRSAWTVLDRNYQVLDWIEFMIPSSRIPENHPVENCGLLILGNHHYILAAQLGCRVDNIPGGTDEYGTSISAVVLQEVKDGRLVFEWSSVEHPELYTALHPEAGYYQSDTLWLDYARPEHLTLSGNAVRCFFHDADIFAEIDRSGGSVTLQSKSEAVSSGDSFAVLRLESKNEIYTFSETDTRRREMVFELFSAYAINSVYKEGLPDAVRLTSMGSETEGEYFSG